MIFNTFDQNGIIAYANNEIDTAWMLAVINDLIEDNNGIQGDINQDEIINILDVVSIVNFVLNGEQDDMADLNNDGIINILDIILLVNIILG